MGANTNRKFNLFGIVKNLFGKKNTQPEVHHFTKPPVNPIAGPSHREKPTTGAFGKRPRFPRITLRGAIRKGPRRGVFGCNVRREI